MSGEKKTYNQWRTQEAREETKRVESRKKKLTKVEYEAIRSSQKSPLYGLEGIEGLRPPMGLGSTYTFETGGKVYRFSRAPEMGLRMDGSPMRIELLPVVDEAIYPEMHGAPRVSDLSSLHGAIQWVDTWKARPPALSKSWFSSLFS